MFSLSNLGQGSCTSFHDILLSGVSEILETRQDNWYWPVSLHQALHVVWTGFVSALNHCYNHKNDGKWANFLFIQFLQIWISLCFFLFYSLSDPPPLFFFFSISAIYLVFVFQKIKEWKCVSCPPLVSCECWCEMTFDSKNKAWCETGVNAIWLIYLCSEYECKMLLW